MLQVMKFRPATRCQPQLINFIQSMRSSSTTSLPIVELRESNIIPMYAAEDIEKTFNCSDLWKTLVPLRLYTLPETGGYLNVATGFYHYEGGYEERSTRRAEMEKSEDFGHHDRQFRSMIHSQRSTIFTEAPIVGDTPEIIGLKTGLAESKDLIGNKNCIYEIRRYKLILGYDTVPKFLNIYGEGLPSKLHAAGTDPSTSLFTLLYNEVGRLNEVIEVWRHGDGTSAMERSRIAARKATQWRKSISEIANMAIEFNNTIHKPTSFSPLK